MGLTVLVVAVILTIALPKVGIQAQVVIILGSFIVKTKGSKTKGVRATPLTSILL